MMHLNKTRIWMALACIWLLVPLLDAAAHNVTVFAWVDGDTVNVLDAGKVQHSIRDLILQRVMALACGYPDANDAGQLRRDPMHKLVAGRDPITGDDLASQPTLSRFENSCGVCAP